MKLKVFPYREVDSTNNIAIDLIKKKKYENGCVYALYQKKGRGRHGKKWISKKGNLFSSIFFRLKKNYPTIEEFNLINTIINIEIINKYCEKKNTFFKPPNDIYVNNKKICGILQEVIILEKKKYLIVGIGVNLVSSPKKLNYKTTNIYEQINKRLSIDEFILEIVKKYEKFINNIYNFNFYKFEAKSKKFLLK